MRLIRQRTQDGGTRKVIKEDRPWLEQRERLEQHGLRPTGQIHIRLCGREPLERRKGRGGGFGSLCGACFERRQKLKVSRRRQPFHGGLSGSGQAQQQSLLPRPPDGLHADGEPIRGVASGKRDDSLAVWTQRAACFLRSLVRVSMKRERCQSSVIWSRSRSHSSCSCFNVSRALASSMPRSAW